MLRNLVLAAVLLVTVPAFALPPAFREVTSKIYRGGRPKGGDLQDLYDRGIDKIVDLENDAKLVRAEAARAADLGLKFVNVPLNASEIPTDAEVDRVVANLIDARAAKSYVHCQRGKDRTGLVVAIYRITRQGWTPADAWHEMLADGFSRKYAKPLEDYFRARTGYRGN